MEIVKVDKIQQAKTDCEKIIAEIIATNPEAKKYKGALISDIKELKFEINKKMATAIVITVPFLLYKLNKQFIPKFINEIQKKKAQHIFIIAQRTIINKKSDFKQRIPKSRTLTQVFDCILEDLIYPATIIGKRMRYRQDGSLLTKVHLADEAQAYLSDKVPFIEKVYLSITNRKIAIEFREETCFIKTKAIKRKAPRITK